MSKKKISTAIVAIGLLLLAPYKPNLHADFRGESEKVELEETSTSKASPVVDGKEETGQIEVNELSNEETTTKETEETVSAEVTASSNPTLEPCIIKLEPEELKVEKAASLPPKPAPVKVTSPSCQPSTPESKTYVIDCTSTPCRSVEMAPTVEYIPVEAPCDSAVESCCYYVEDNTCASSDWGCYAINPPSHRYIECGWNLSLSVDYLYWQARSDGLPYAIEASDFDTATLTVIEQIDRVCPEAGSGVRVGVDYLVPCMDGWNVAAAWTWFHSHAIDDASLPSLAGAANQILPIWTNREFRPRAISAHADYNLYVDLVDFEMGRWFYVGKLLSIQPHAGFRGAWIGQHLDANYVFNSAPFSRFLVTSKNDITFRGFGIRTGLNTEWSFCHGLSILANTNFDLLWSKTKVSQIEYNPSGSIRSQTTDNEIYSMTPVVELFFGLAWDVWECFNLCNWDMKFRIGWEEQYFVNFIQFNQYPNDEEGPLSIHEWGGLGFGGLVAGVSVSF